MKKQGSTSKNIFVKFWNWLKNTAWIQPLLIVGVIFAIIFSIPAISSAIDNNKERRNSPVTYYSNYQLSLNKKEKKNAYKLVEDYYSSENPLKGQKFFLVFVDENCTYCNEAQKGFKTFQSEYKSELKGFKNPLRTIFTDEVDKDNKKEDLFLNWLKDDATMDFLDETVGIAKSSYYYNKKFLGQSDFAAADSVLDGINKAYDQSNSFATPTIFLIDFTDDTNTPGVQQAFISLPGATNIEKAAFLYDAWTGTGNFGK